MKQLKPLVHTIAQIYAMVFIVMTAFFMVMVMIEHGYNFSLACQQHTGYWIIGCTIGAIVFATIYDKTRHWRS